MGREGVEVALVAVFMNAQVRRAAEVGNARAALLDEVGHHLIGALVVINHHGAYVATPKVFDHAVEKYQRNVLLAHGLKVAEAVRGVGQRY